MFNSTSIFTVKMERNVFKSKIQLWCLISTKVSFLYFCKCLKWTVRSILFDNKISTTSIIINGVEYADANVLY